ncbi:MAG: hypothetical protein JSV93_05275 [Candidatus Omnitrophota bacterium]|nr:MAG: hypothetical protein JSV93_05275 [Candidatus Omnitrophota bacterium]
MRELIFKNLTTPASKKRDISVEETVERNGLVSSTKKRSIYFIRGAHHIESKGELKKWIDKRSKNPDLNKKFFHILRDYSDKNKQDKLICKMRGSFYVVSGESVYNIVFVHAIKISYRQARDTN